MIMKIKKFGVFHIGIYIISKIPIVNPYSYRKASIGLFLEAWRAG